MFFILSKTVSYLVMPVSLITLSFLLCIVFRRRRVYKIFFAVGMALLLLFSNDFISNELMKWWEIEPIPYRNVERHQLAIVLTGSTIPVPYPDDRVYFARGADRVTHTVQLYKKGLIERILISGGSGRLMKEDEPEANKFRKAMVMMGVDSLDIIIENETRNTYESAVAVKPMLDSLGYRAEDCFLITSAFHMRRSLACYRKAGVNLEPFSTDIYSHPTEFYPDVLFVPKVEAIVIWQKLIKEWVGMAAYKMAGYI